jgi:streptomycin 6-kinase
MCPVTISVPRALRDASVRDGRDWWLDELAVLIERLQRQWSLNLGPPLEPGGQTAWVAPARDEAGNDLVLKLAWRHTEAEHEADGLGTWNGNGTVRVHRVTRFDHTVALLLERCRPGTPLSGRPEAEQDVVVARLLRRLWLQPELAWPFRPLQAMCDEWSDEFERLADGAPLEVDPGLARDGIALFRALPSTANRSVLLCTDLHAGNVLAAERDPWLVIDPKPYVGDPTFDVLQHLLNCDERLRADAWGFAHRMAELLELDHDRLMVWLFARCVLESPTWPGLGDLARRIAPT